MNHTRRIAEWAAAAFLALAPWLLMRWPATVPLVFGLAVLLHPPWRRSAADPAGAGVVAASAVAALAFDAGWGPAGAWLMLGALVAAVAAVSSGPSRRPDAADLVALLGWGGAFLVAPAALGDGAVRPLAGLLLVLAARRVVPRRSAALEAPAGPPRREVEGRLRLESAVPVDESGLPAGRPLSLEVEPGSALAVVVAPERAEPLAALLAGRRAPAAGRILVDGAPIAAGDRLVAVVAPGEAFVAGSLEDNLQLLSSDELGADTVLAAREACGLDDVDAALEEAALEPDGSPLTPLPRLRLLAARALVSDCRIVVALDPAPWGRPGEIAAWHAALVRASVGRASVWLTTDRTLAARADRVLDLAAGGPEGPLLQPLDRAPAGAGGGSA